MINAGLLVVVFLSITQLLYAFDGESILKQKFEKLKSRASEVKELCRCEANLKLELNDAINCVNETRALVSETKSLYQFVDTEDPNPTRIEVRRGHKLQLERSERDLYWLVFDLSDSSGQVYPDSQNLLQGDACSSLSNKVEVALKALTKTTKRSQY